MAMIFRGAEAIVETIDWNNHIAISKTRNVRGYRHPDLEKKLVKERLRGESRIIDRLISRGLAVPSLYAVDVSKSCLIMEFIDGITLERALRTESYESYLIKVSELLASIHLEGVIHGDPTTSNFMVAEKIYAIDFGLASISDDSESRASDIRVFLESLESHHSDISGRDIFLKTYSKRLQSIPVIEALKVLELRGRYNLMRG